MKDFRNILQKTLLDSGRWELLPSGELELLSGGSDPLSVVTFATHIAVLSTMSSHTPRLGFPEPFGAIVWRVYRNHVKGHNA